MTELNLFGRAVGWSALLGAFWGTVCAAFLLWPWDMGSAVAFVPATIAFGGSFGSIVGVLLGVPTVLIVSLLDVDLTWRCWVGAVCGGALPGALAIWGGATGAFETVLVLATAIIAVLAAGSAWIGVRQVFRTSGSRADLGR